MNNYNFNDFLFKCLILFLFSFSLIAQEKESDIYLHVLGTIQDGGSPHLGCKKDCCLNLSEKEKNFRKVTSIEIFNQIKISIIKLLNIILEKTVFVFDFLPCRRTIHRRCFV